MIAVNIAGNLRNRVIAFITILVCTTIIVLLKTSSAGAAPLGAATFPDPAASTGYPLYMTIGRGEFPAEVAGSIIVSDQPGSVGVWINEAQWCGSDSAYAYQALDLPKEYSVPYFATNYAVFGIDSSYGVSGMLASTSSGLSAQCSGRDLGFTFNFGPAQYNAATKKYVAVFLGSIGMTNPAYTAAPAAAENSFSISITGPGTTRAYPIPSGIGGITGSWFNMSNRNRPVGTNANYVIDIKMPCSVRTATPVSMQFFDVDNGQYQNFGSYPYMTFGVSPLFSPVNVTGGDDQPSQLFSGSMQPDTTYTLAIAGLSRPNAITYSVSVPLSSVFATNDCSVPPPPPPPDPGPGPGPVVDAPNEPVGFADSCFLSGSTTVILGWAYDNNAPWGSTLPEVNIGVSGQARQTVGSPLDYRTAAINSYLDSNGYGNSARDSGYGFRAEYNGLYSGSNYILSGVVMNVGSGNNKNLGLSGSFPGGVIPQSCLSSTPPPPPPSNCADPSAINFGSPLPCVYPPPPPPNSPLQGGIRVDSSCTTLKGAVSDPDLPYGGVFRIHIRFDSQSAPLAAEVFTTSTGPTAGDGQWVWTVPDSFKTASARSIWVSGLGKNAAGVEDNWVQMPNNGAISVGPCQQPPVPDCLVNSIGVSANEPFYLSVTLKNNSSSNIVVSGLPTTYYQIYQNMIFNGAPMQVNIITGFGAPYNTSTNSYMTFPQTISPGGSLVIRSQTPTPTITLATTGSYGVRWGVPVSAGPPILYSAGDCGTIKANAIDVSAKPYVRFYGNDVIAGGAYGSTCSVSSGAQASGYGIFTGAQNHTTYKGTASELAVFASGQIGGVLPGSQKPTRTAVAELSFANQSLGSTVISGSPPFGGNFADVLCADDYWGQKPPNSDMIALPTQPAASPNPAARKVDINSLANGRYYYSGELHIFADNPVAAGKRVTIYNEGNTVLGRAGISPLGFKIAYDTTTQWANIDQIPLIKVITLGNIYVDDGITQADGMFVAVPNPSVPNTGEIHTCSQFDFGVDLTKPTLNQAIIASRCQKKLIVNGAFIAKRVYMLRMNGNITSAVPGPEAYTSANIAEVFRFSPELYLALLSEGKGQNDGVFDAILSLPPAL